MDSFIQQSISNTVTSAVTIAVTTIQTKYKNKIFSLREIIEKSFLLEDSALMILLPNPDTSAKASSPTNNLTKVTERCN